MSEPATPPPSGDETQETIADRQSARVPDEAATPDTRASISGLRASLFPRVDGSGSGSAASTAMSQASAAMRADEIKRLHLFYKLIITVISGCLVALPFVDGNDSARWAFAGGLLSYVAVLTIFIIRIQRDPAQYRERNFYLPGAFGIVGAYTGVFFWGLFSPAPAVVVMVLYFNSLIGSFRYTLFVYLGCAFLQFFLSTLIVVGLIDDVGMVQATGLSTISQLALQGVVQLALLCTFLIARLSRRNTQDSIQRLESAVRDVAQRDALLNEARQELERAAWVGGPGRFTEQILGSYKLGLIIGRGAMGEVYEGIHTKTGADAAVKLLHRNVLSDTSQVVRFAREAEAVAKLDSPHVVRVLEVGDTSSPIPFIALERLVGDDLAAELRKRRKLDTSEVVELASQLGHGIDAAAAAGIVHRDLKPQNIFFSRAPDGSGTWKILDFGVSKLLDGSGTLTRGRIVGTPTYMAPEQARGKQVDHRADIYALGAVSYRALTGHPAFTGREIPQILYDVVHNMPRRPSRLAPELGERFDLVLAIALAKKPADRFVSGTELAAALDAARAGSLPRELRQRGERILRKWSWGERR